MFDFTIKADPTQALRAAQDVERSLAELERRNRALESTSKNAFSGVAAAMNLELQILERIRGPMERHQREVDALHSLWKKGKLSVAEYNAELERATQNASKGAPAAAAGAPSAGGGAGGFASMAAGYLSAGAAIGIGKKVLDLGGDYQQLENRLRSVTSTQAELHALMGKTHGIADRTRSDWGSTSEAFVRFTRATKDLGLSQDQTLRVTETLAKATKLQGASSEEASSAMLQLSQALQSGVLAGDEFKSLSETMPELLNKIAETMGKPRSELKKLAADGQITADVIVKALQKAGPEVDAAFAQMKPTVADAWTKFKNDATETAGELLKNSNVTELLVKALTSLAQGFKDIAAVVGPVVRVVGDVASAFSDFKDKLGFVGDALDFVTSPLKQAKAAIGVLGDAVDYFSGGPAVNWLEAVQKINKEAETFRDRAEAGTKAWKGFIEIGLAVPGVFDKAGAALDKFFAPGGSGRAFFGLGEDLGNLDFSSFKLNNAQVAATAKDIREAAQALQKFNHENAEFIRIFEAVANPRRREGSTQAQYFQTPYGEMSRAEFDAFIEGNEKLAHLFDDVPEKIRAIGPVAAEASAYAKQLLIDMPKEAAKRYEEWEKRATDAISGMDRGLKGIRDHVMDIGATVESTLISGFEKMNDMLVDGFMTGKFAWRDFAKQIEKDLLRLALQIIEMRILMAALGGGAGGGGGGGLLGALFGGSHASGGSYTAPSGGGPDSHLVMFRMSPRERADFTPEGSAGGATRTVVQVSHDPRDLLDVLETPAGVARVHSVTRRNPGIVGRNPLRRN